MLQMMASSIVHSTGLMAHGENGSLSTFEDESRDTRKSMMVQYFEIKHSSDGKIGMPWDQHELVIGPTATHCANDDRQLRFSYNG